jgi:hypothetical protein
MERLVLFLVGCWLWLTRKRRTLRYRAIADTLRSAQLHLWSDYANRASTRDRGFMLPDQVEALAILQQQSAKAFRTADRLDSIVECYRFASEELAPADAEYPRAA